MLKQRDSIANGARGGGLNGSTELRLRNQLERALQHCFGAEEGLRVLVTLATTQMLASGLSRIAIRDELTRVATDHPTNGNGSAPRIAALTALMLKWSDGGGVQK